MKKNTGWITQFAIGIAMIAYFLMVRSTINDIDSYFNQGILMGVGGMFLFWGMREILGALAKQYEIRKDTKQEGRQ